MRFGVAIAVACLSGSVFALRASGQEFQPLPRGALVGWNSPASYDLGKVLGRRAPGYNGTETPAGWWVWDRATGTFSVVPESPGVTQIDSLDNSDFIAFINLFFAGDPRADLGVPGGADGAFDNNDFIAFINAFFAGC